MRPSFILRIYNKKSQVFGKYFLKLLKLWGILCVFCNFICFLEMKALPLQGVLS